MLCATGGIYVLRDTNSLPEGVATYHLAAGLVALCAVELRKSPEPFGVTSLFLVSALLFFCSPLLLTFDGIRVLTEVEGIVTEHITTAELDAASLIVATSLSITFLATGLLRLTGQNERANPTSDPNIGQREANLGTGLLIALLPFAVNDAWQQLQFSQAEGFEALYATGGPSSTASRLTAFLFACGFMFVCAFERRRGRFLVAATVYCLVAVLSAAKGVRGAIVAPLVYSVWHYRAMFGRRIAVSTLMSGGLATLAFVTAVTVWRSGSSTSELDPSSIVSSVLSQGRSLQLIALYRRVAGDVSAYGNYTVFSNLTMPVSVLLHPELRIPGQTIHQVLYSNNMKFILTYVLDEQYYFSGGGVGSCYVLELLEAGPVIFSSLSLALGIALHVVPRLLRREFWRFLAYPLLTTLLYLPRGDFFPNLLVVGKFAVAYFGLTLTRYLFGVHRRRPAAGVS